MHQSRNTTAVLVVHFLLLKCSKVKVVTSVTILVDLLDFGQLFKAFGNNQFAQISQILRHFFVKASKSIIFLVKSFWPTFTDIWRYFSGHTGCHCHCEGQLSPSLFFPPGRRSRISFVFWSHYF